MTALRSIEQLLQAYPDGTAETANPGIAHSDLAREAAGTVALGKKKQVRDRCTGCGLRLEAWQELAEAHHDFVSAQAYLEAALTQARPDPASKQRLAELTTLRRELLAQATFYFTAPVDVKRLAAIRKGTSVPDRISNVRALVQMILPRRALILDPEFDTAWLDKAIALAGAEEKARAARLANAAAKRERAQIRRVRDRTVARVQGLLAEIRMYGRHAFRHDPKLWAAFGSEYLRTKRKRLKKKRGQGGGGGDQK